MRRLTQPLEFPKIVGSLCPTLAELVNDISVMSCQVFQHATAAVDIPADLSQTLFQNLDASPLANVQATAVKTPQVRVQAVQQLARG
jgi:hypothetical protein